MPSHAYTNMVVEGRVSGGSGRFQGQNCTQDTELRANSSRAINDGHTRRLRRLVESFCRARGVQPESLMQSICNSNDSVRTICGAVAGPTSLPRPSGGGKMLGQPATIRGILANWHLWKIVPSSVHFPSSLGSELQEDHAGPGRQT